MDETVRERKSLPEKVLDDLRKTGFLSEMRAIETLMQNSCWQVHGGGSFYDRDQEKARDIDLVATTSIHNSSDRPYYVRYVLAVEVKKSEQPWVVFKQPLGRYFSQTPALCFTSNIRENDELRSVKNFGLASINEWIGYNIHEAFKPPDKSSRSFSSMVTACKAAEDQGGLQASDIAEDTAHVTIVRPVVVLDGILMSTIIGEDAKPIIESIDSAAMMFTYRSPNYKRGNYLVDLVTLESLRNYADICEEHFGKIASATKPELIATTRGHRQVFSQ